MTTAQRIAITSHVRRVATCHVERVSVRIERPEGADLFAVRYHFNDHSAGRFVREPDERGRTTTRFEEVQA
jgi:hypothetical protein